MNWFKIVKSLQKKLLKKLKLTPFFINLIRSFYLSNFFQESFCAWISVKISCSSKIKLFIRSKFHSISINFTQIIRSSHRLYIIQALTHGLLFNQKSICFYSSWQVMCHRLFLLLPTKSTKQQLKFALIEEYVSRDTSIPVEQKKYVFLMSRHCASVEWTRGTFRLAHKKKNDVDEMNIVNEPSEVFFFSQKDKKNHFLSFHV